MYSNKVTLIGFLGNDAEVRTSNDRSLTTLSLPKLTFQVIRRTIATLAQKKGTVKDVQGVMRHSRTATTTDVYMQEIPESVQATVNSINRELRKSSEKNHRKAVTPSPGELALERKVHKRGAGSLKAFGNLTPNDTKRSGKELVLIS